MKKAFPLILFIIWLFATVICKSYFSNEENKILFKFTIELLDPVGASVEIWEISVAEILEINFGDLTYRNDDVITLKLIVKPFNCVLI
jgi:hypothetical protein